MTRRRILILGGTRVFGSRLARHLAAHPDGLGDAELIVTSRDAGRAERLAGELRGLPARGMAVDTRAGWPAAQEAAAPWAVVDCSGPFQGAGHATAAAALAAGAHMIDLADARDHLAGYAEALDGIARASGATGLAGASSTPALSGAVARRLTEGWTSVEAVEIAIVPGGRSEVGRAVLEAVLGYAGRPVPVWCDGRLASTPGWMGARTIDVPGLGRRRVAPVETIDAERLGPALGASRVTFRAGLESTPEQRGLEQLARLRRHGLAPDLRGLAGPLRRVRRLTRLATGDTGGMLVAASGARPAGPSGAPFPCRATWTLVARRDHGPQVPTLAAAAALRALARGDLAPGARLADEALSLDRIEAEAQPYDIETRIEVEPCGSQPDRAPGSAGAWAHRAGAGPSVGEEPTRAAAGARGLEGGL